MSTIEFDRLKKICGELIRTNGLKTTTVKGREAIHLFWYGVMAQAKENPAFIGICLLSGRHEDLVDLTGEIDNSEGT